MRRYLGTVFLLMCAAIVVAGVGHAQPAGDSRMGLPEELDNFYPPKSPAPVFMLAMIEMSTSLSGIACNTLEGDLGNAKASFEAFQAKYSELATMIPTWEDNYPMGAVEELGAAVEGGQPGAIMQALGKVGAYCHECHAATMPQVQWRYHWEDVWELMVSDPLSGQEVPFGDFKLMMQTNFTGIGVQLAEGQQERAAKQLEGFEARFAAFKGICESCHDTERKYYVSADIDELIAQLRGAVTAEQVDGSAVQAAMQKIGQESCSKCHRVHGPAAFAKAAHK